MNQLNGVTALAQLGRTGGSNLAGVVGRIVEHLNLKQFTRIIELADRAQEPFDHIDLVKNGQLHCHLGQTIKLAQRDGGPRPVLQKQVNDEVAMDPVRGEADQNTEVANRPNNVTEASLHKVSTAAEYLKAS